MSNDTRLKQLGLNENLEPVSIGEHSFSAGEIYKAKFSPDFPPIPQFAPNRYVYKSLEPTSVSIIGRHDLPDSYEIAIVIPRDLEDGTYPIEESSKVFASVAADRGYLHGKKGSIKLSRNKEKKSIEATFHFEIEQDGKTYKVVDGDIYLLATGDL